MNGAVFTIYCHTSPSGKRYIGQTVKGMMDRWRRGHLRSRKDGPFERAIRKYGPEAFGHEVLQVVHTQQEADEAETKWIAHFQSTDRRYGYNIHPGGRSGGSPSPDTLRRMSLAQRAAHANQTPEGRADRARKIGTSLRLYRAMMPPEEREAISRRVADQAAVVRQTAVLPSMERDGARRRLLSVLSMRARQIELQGIADQKNETWRAIDGLDGYEVSNLGRVRSWRLGGKAHGLANSPRIRKPQVGPNDGAMYVMLSVEGRRAMRKVHHLVLDAFVRPRHPAEEARHLDGDPANCAVSNLAWKPPSDRDMRLRLGDRHTIGHRNGNAKLTLEQVEEIRSSSEAGRSIARRFGVSEATVSRVRRGIRYVA